MGQAIVRRLLLMPVTLFVISILFFGMLRMIPGDTVSALYETQDAGGVMSEAGLLKLRKDIGLDRPFHVQYFDWMGHVLRGDLGFSFRFRMPVSEVLAKAIPPTLELMAFAVFGSLIIGIPLGIISAYKQDSPADYFVRMLAITGLTLPAFVVAAIFLVVLVKVFHWIPPVDYVPFTENPMENLTLMAFPATVLVIGGAAPFMRVIRSQLLEVIREDYVRTARAKGLSEQVIIRRHALRNALLPVITLAAVQVSRLISGAVVVEIVFGIPGVGDAIVEGARGRDYALLQSMVILIALAVLVINLATDVMYSWIDPRIRRS